MNSKLEVSHYRSQPRFLQAASALSGTLAVILYLAALTVLGNLHPGYNHLQQFPSEIAMTGAPYALYMNLTFNIVGLLTMLLGVGLFYGIDGRRTARAALIVVVLLGLGLFLAGFFPCDPGCTTPVTLRGKLHGVVGLPTLLSSLVGPFVMARLFRDDRGWQALSRFSLGMGILGVIIFPIWVALAAIDLAGLGAILQLVPQLGWPLVLSIHLLRRSMRSFLT